MNRKEKVIVEVNNNFHILYRKDKILLENKNYKKYREQWNKNPKNFIVENFPLHLDIESTNICNLKCPFCSFGPTQGQNPGMMDWDLYKRIIDESKEHGLCSIKLSIRGEPLLHPRISEMVKYAKDSGIVDVYFNTNGVLLKEEIVQKLIEAGLDRISVSFEGTTKEIFEKNRVGANYENVVKNIDNFILCREKRKVVHPKIRIQSVLIPEIEDRLDEYRDFWKGKGVDEVAYIDFEKEPSKNEDLFYPWCCPQLWQRISIWYDGTILPCVHDTYGLMQMGNIKDSKIADVWKNELETAYRNLHKNGQGELLYSCAICPLRAGQVRKLKKREK